LRGEFLNESQTKAAESTMTPPRKSRKLPSGAKAPFIFDFYVGAKAPIP